MAFTASQIKEFDRAAYAAQLVLRISLADLDLFLTTEERGPIKFRADGTPEEHHRGAAIIRSISEITYDAMMTPSPSGDGVSALTVEALNVPMAIHAQNALIPSPVKEGKLSDYLSQYSLAGPPVSPGYAFRPAQAQLYLAPLGDAEVDHFYLFKGLLSEFEVVEEGTVVVMRFIEDTRWDRRRPYSMTRKNFIVAPQESLGETFPICYGQFGLWHSKDFCKNQTVNGTVADINMPLFPVCLNLHETLCMGVFRSNDVNYQRDSEWLIARHKSNPVGDSPGTRAFIIPISTHEVAILTPGEQADRSGVEFLLTTLMGLRLPSSSTYDYLSDAGLEDLKVVAYGRIQDKYIGQATLFPSKRIAGNTSGMGLDNLDSLFGLTHRRRGPQNMIDGDRYSWFKDDVSSSSLRVCYFELGGQYTNLGCVLDVRVEVCARRRSGSGTLNVYTQIDFAGAPPNSSSGVASLTPNTDGYAFAAISLTPSLILSASQTREWQFIQTDVDPQVSMPIGLGWTKSVATDVWDIIQFAVKVKFNPHRKFLEIRERIVDRTISGEINRVTGRTRPDRIVTDRYLYEVFGDATPPTMRNVHYFGPGVGVTTYRGVEPYWVGAPSTHVGVQNPAYIMRDAILSYGGEDLLNYGCDNPSWPVVHENQFETAGTRPYDWNTVASVLNAAVIAAAAPGTAETFKLSANYASWNGVREIVRSICTCVPGLRVLVYPEASSLDAGNRYRNSFGCLWPQTGAPITFRRRVDLRTDTISTSFKMTAREEVINTVRLRYGWSTMKGSYTRELYATASGAAGGAFDTGMPRNTQNSGADSGINNTAALDYEATNIGLLMNESYIRYGTQRYYQDLPYVFRWHEALAIRNYLLRWWACQRVRLTMVVNMHVLDLRVGDVFQLSAEADDYFECRVPIKQLPAQSGQNWSGITWYVDSVTYIPNENGLVLAKIGAINNERYGLY